MQALKKKNGEAGDVTSITNVTGTETNYVTPMRKIHKSKGGREGKQGQFNQKGKIDGSCLFRKEGRVGKRFCHSSSKSSWRRRRAENKGKDVCKKRETWGDAVNFSWGETQTNIQFQAKWGGWIFPLRVRGDKKVGGFR